MSPLASNHEMGGILGNYRLIRPLGVGGMGQVFLAEHTLLGRLAAVKVLHADLSHEQEPLARFFNEARASAALRHPGLIEVYDFGQDERGGAFIVMELLEGMGLRELLAREKRLPEALAIGVARQVAEAMAVAHAHGIVHRDLKPENLFLVPDSQIPLGWRVKVLDFGIAKLFGDGLRNGLATRSGYILGTPTYMAPEQCHGAAEVDGRADVYALGCILFEMLTGRPPFVNEGVGALIAAHMFDPPLEPSQLVPELAPELDQAIAWMLTKAPDERVASMADAALLLAAIPHADPSALSESLGWSTTLAMGSGPRDLPLRPTPRAATPPAPVAAVMAAPPDARTVHAPTTIPAPLTRRPRAPVTKPGAAAVSVPRTARSRRRRLWFDVLVVLMGLGTLTAAGLFELAQRRDAVALADALAPNATAPVHVASLAGTTATAPIAEPPAPEATVVSEAPAMEPNPPLYVQLRIETRPSGARVTRVHDSALLGRTPLTLTLNHQDGRMMIALAKPAHHTTVVELPLDRDASAIVELAPRLRPRVASPRPAESRRWPATRAAPAAQAPARVPTARKTPAEKPTARQAPRQTPPVRKPPPQTPPVRKPQAEATTARETPAETSPIDDGAIDPYGE